MWIFFCATFILVRPSAHACDPTTSPACCVLWCEENTESLDPDLHALQTQKVLTLIASNKESDHPRLTLDHTALVPQI